MTGLRAIAAYMVFFFHALTFSSFHAPEKLRMILDELHIGVTIFFVLSGFLIAHIYYGKEVRWKDFFVKRFARIFPVYFVASTITICYSNFDWLTYILNITFLRGFSSQYALTGVVQGWSLTVEEMFYFLAPLLFLAIRFSKHFLVIFPSMFFMIGILLVSFGKSIHFLGFFDSNYFMLQSTFFGRCTEFFVGIAIALLYKKYGAPNAKGWFTFVGIVVILAHLFAMVVIRNSELVSSEYRSFVWLFVKNVSLPVLGISVFFWGLLTESTFISRILSTKLFILLGKSSYVFYLVHVGYVLALFLKISGNILFLFVALNIFSIVGYKLFEEPVNQYLRKKLLSHNKQQLQPVLE